MRLYWLVAAGLGVAFGALGAVLALLAFHGPLRVPIPFYGIIETSPWGLVAVGFLGGAMATAALNWAYMRGYDPKRVDDRTLSRQTLNVVAVGGVLAQFVFADSAVHAGLLAAQDAALTLLFGAAAVMAIVPAIDGFQRGGGLEFESRWGGLGGGLGGWRVSPGAILTIIGVASAVAAVAVVHPVTIAAPGAKAGSLAPSASPPNKAAATPPVRSSA